jgi:GDP-4-dehydro-6-deoxy-D-mannose reductase
MRVFLTGATGFAGSHLVSRLLAAGHHIIALVHGPSSKVSLPAHARLEQVAGDLLDVAVVKTAVSQARPDVIYHLAGQASPAISWEKPGQTLALNSVGTANLLQAAVSYGRPRVVVVTSADLYGNVSAADLPLTEATLPEPAHPYGVSKWAASQLVPLFWQHFGLPVVEVRPFNHIGPQQALGFVVPDFASQLAAIKLGQKSNRMSVGNLDAQRDFTDVRDVVRAYMMLAEKGEPGQAYLVCSGQPVTIHTLLTTLSDLAGVDIRIEHDPARMRPLDMPCLYGSYEKINACTGWQPEIHLRQSLADVLAEWVQRYDHND